MKISGVFKTFGLAAFYLLACASGARAGGDDWKVVTPAELAMKEPVVEKDADAEVLLWEVRVNDADQDLVFSHYIRIKIFTEKGKENASRIDIIYLGNYKIADIAGRTVKADGTIVPLKKEAIFDRTIVKLSGRKVNAKSFAMPAADVGSIIEYRWREIRPGRYANHLRLQFQREIPVEQVTYYLKPSSEIYIRGSQAGMRSQMFNGPDVKFKKEANGFYSTSMTNVHAFHEEPRMPPEDQMRTWMLIYYTTQDKPNPQQYWQKEGKEIYDAVKPLMKVNDDVKRAVAQAVGDATTPSQKLQRLFDYCQLKIKNIEDDANGLTDIDREKARKNESPADTLKRGQGTSSDIDLLFATMATAAGFDARVAMISDRSEIFFDPTFTDDYFIGSGIVAVKVGEKWEFFEPSERYITFGQLPWYHEGQQALVTDPKNAEFVTTPVTKAEKSLEKDTADLRLAEDGTIEGDVRVEYTGHLAAVKKEEADDDSPQQREQSLIDAVKARMSTAELSNVKIENVTDPVKPLTYSYHVRVPGYAQRTGKRLFLQPAFFEKGVAALFTASTRKYSIYLHYPWMEQESVSIKLPSGFTLDHAESPAGFNASDVVKYDVNIAVAGGNQELLYKRTLSVNGMMFPLSVYDKVKRVFDAVHEGDNHTITLRQGAGN